MPWDILTSASIVSGQQFVPDTYGAASTITIPNTAGGIVIVAADATNLTRFVNIALAPTLTAGGAKILVYVGVGITPTASLHSFIITSGYQDYNWLINGQEIRAIAQAGQTITANIQIANGVKR